MSNVRHKPREALQDQRPARMVTVLSAAQVADDSPQSIVPLAPPAPPNLPKGLRPEARTAWDSFWRSRMADAIDRETDLPGLHRWIAAYDEWIRAVHSIRRQRVVPGSQGQPVLSPLGDYIRQREATLERLEAQYGMTPRSRLALGLTLNQGRYVAAKVEEVEERRDARRSAGAQPVNDPEFADDWDPA
jgi:P27 family predicted phage terminase small subunit